MPYLKLYSLYCSGYFAALELLTKIRTERPAAAAATISRAETELAVHRQASRHIAVILTLHELAVHRQASRHIAVTLTLHCRYIHPLHSSVTLRQGEGDLRLGACLIRPVKRLCLYPLLLTSLLKEIESCEHAAAAHASFRRLSLAATAVQSMANEVNEMVRLAENRSRLIEVRPGRNGA